MSDVLLADFPRGRAAAPVPLSSRAAAAALTAALYGMILAAHTWAAAWMVPRRPPPPELVAKLVIAPAKRELPAPPKILAHLVKPPAQTASPPAFLIASDTPPPQAALPPSIAASSPMISGVPDGSGASQGGSANGTSGKALSGCFDAVWAKAVSDRIGQFFIYPASEKRRHVGGLVLVDFGVRSNGRLSFVKINQSSGVRALDQAALDMVRFAQPLPRIPERMHLGRADVELPIFFGTPDKNFTPTPGNCAQ